MKAEKKGGGTLIETDMKRQNHYIQQDLLIDSPDYKNNIFFFFSVTPVGCKFHLQWQKAYKEAKQQKLFSIGDPAFFLTYKRTNQALIKTLLLFM